MEISLLLSAAQSTQQATNTSFPSTNAYVPTPSQPLQTNPNSSLPLQRLSQAYSPPSSETYSGTSVMSPISYLPQTRNYFALASQGKVEKKSNKPFRCTLDSCDATFGQKGSLTRHIKSRHEKLRPHCCELCKKSFSALWTLRVHQRNVHLKSKPHKCHLCDKSFGELFNKSKHIAIVHEGKRPFSCPICSRAFGYKGDMRKHVVELHEQTGRPFQCLVPACGVKFARKRYLRRHENLSHKDLNSVRRRELPSSPETSPNLSYPAPGVGVSALSTQRPPSFYLGKAAGESSRSIIPSQVHSYAGSMGRSSVEVPQHGNLIPSYP